MDTKRCPGCRRYLLENAVRCVICGWSEKPEDGNGGVREPRKPKPNPPSIELEKVYIS